MPKVKRLLYIADPMCSWCYGFAPVMASLRRAFGQRLVVESIAGGLRPGTTQPMTPELREMVVHHWREVNAQTGRQFRYEGALPEGFIYDTEPSCRALVTVRALKPEAAFDFLHALHEAFYALGRDITRIDELASIAREQGVTKADFMAHFGSSAMRDATEADFASARALGVDAFPAVVLQQGEQHSLLTLGYQPFNRLQPQIRRWLEAG